MPEQRWLEEWVDVDWPCLAAEAWSGRCESGKCPVDPPCKVVLRQ